MNNMIFLADTTAEYGVMMIVWLIGAACFIALIIAMINMFINISKQRKFSQVQSNLLVKMAEKAGVTKEEIYIIIHAAFPTTKS